MIVISLKKVYNNPQNAGLVSKKFPHGRKYAILERYCSVLIFRTLLLLDEMLTPECAIIHPFSVVN